MSFALARAAHVSMRVMDVSGREIARPLESVEIGPGTWRTSIPAEHLPSGVYFLEVSAGRDRDRIRWVVTR